MQYDCPSKILQGYGGMKIVIGWIIGAGIAAFFVCILPYPAFRKVQYLLKKLKKHMNNVGRHLLLKVDSDTSDIREDKGIREIRRVELDFRRMRHCQASATFESNFLELFGCVKLTDLYKLRNGVKLLLAYYTRLSCFGLAYTQVRLQAAQMRLAISKATFELGAMCFEKCVPRPGQSLTSSQHTCIKNCAARYEDTVNYVQKRLIKKAQDNA
eukprot:g2641.t1